MRKLIARWGRKILHCSCFLTQFWRGNWNSLINGDKVVDFACLISTAAIGCCFIRRTLNTVECRIDLSRQLIFLSVRAAEINILQPAETKKIGLPPKFIRLFRKFPVDSYDPLNCISIVWTENWTKWRAIAVIIGETWSSLLFFTGIVDVGETRKRAWKSPLIHLACAQGGVGALWQLHGDNVSIWSRSQPHPLPYVPAHTFLLNNIHSRGVCDLNHVDTAKEICHQHLKWREKQWNASNLLST